MGYWYWRPIKTDWAVNEATTNRFEFEDKGKISALWIEIAPYLAAELYNVDNPWPLQQTDWKVMGNGNYPLVDAKARYVEALNFWQFGHALDLQMIGIVSNSVYQHAIIPFGRYLGDPEYGLDTDEFSGGIQFEETNSFSTSYYTDGYSNYNIYGLFRKNPEPGLFSRGFRRIRQVVDRDTASATKYEYKLPIGGKVRQIHLFSEPDRTSYYQANSVYTTAQQIFLSIKGKDEYLWDNVYALRVAPMVHEMYDREIDRAFEMGGTGSTTPVDTTIGWVKDAESAMTVNQGGQTTVNIAHRTEQVQRVDTYNLSGSTLAATFNLRARGISMHGDIPLLLIDPEEKDVTKYLNPAETGDVYVAVTEGASAGNWRVVLDEIHEGQMK